MLQTLVESQSSGEVLKKEIENAKPVAKWECYRTDEYYGVVIQLFNEQNIISATLTFSNDDPNMIYIDMFQVDEKMRGHGIGTKLMKALIAEAKFYGAEVLRGHVTSKSALKTRARVFGAENLQFFINGTNQRKMISYEEVLESNLKFDVVVDLTAIDTKDWERPVAN